MPSQVRMWIANKPGMEALSKPWEWEHRRRYFVELPEGDIDIVAMQHVENFWKPYGLHLQFKLEHKRENDFERAAYWNKSDYALQTPKGLVYAIRGKDRAPKEGHKLHPSFPLFDSILEGSDVFPEDLEYTKGGILKIGKWKVIQSSGGYETLRVLRPGDSMPLLPGRGRTMVLR